MRIFILLMLLFFVTNDTCARNLTVDLQEVELGEAIRLLAKTVNMNVVIDSNVQGTVSLHLRNVNPESTLSMLLSSHGLTKWQQGNLWLIGLQADILKRKEAIFKLQTFDEESARLVTQTWQINYANVSDVAHMIKGEASSLLSKRGQLSIDVRTNIICIEDIASSIARINRLIHKIDVPVKQIAIEARLASVDNDSERELGVEFTQSTPRSDNGEIASGSLGRYSLTIAKLAHGSELDVKLLALERAGHAELISRPSLFTANQQTASIEAGEEVPYQEVAESGGTAVMFKRAVLGLKVTPKILPGNKVLLLLQINQDRPSNKLVLGMPTISTRQIMTNVLVKNSQTVVLGGIYEVSAEAGTEGLPFLSQIPMIGWLFKQQSERKNKRELLIFVTPTIVA